MKFTLAPTGHARDPFGFDKPVEFEVPERTAAPDPFKLGANNSFLPAAPAVLEPGDVFSAFGPADTAIKGGGHSFPEFRLAKAETGEADYFESTRGRGGAPITLARAQKDDSLFAAFGPEATPEEEPGVFRKGAETEFHKFAQFSKVEETDDGNVMVWGVATLEQPDLDNEVCHYPTAKDAYQAWSAAAAQRTSSAGQQVSLGPIRYQHSTEPAGKAVKLQYNDDAREIWLGSVPISDDIRKELQDGFLTGYSQGGSYAWRKCQDCGKSLSLQQANNYCPDCKKQVQVLFGLKRLSEVSYVDSPCTGKGFQYVKSDGTSRFVNFTKRVEPARTNFRVIEKTCIFKGRGDFAIWEATMEINGRQRKVVMSPDTVLVV
jgi:hypothetical protein